MSGGGTGRGSGRAHFRSKLGCCICGTKSSSSRFTASERYAEHFGPCFGEKASKRSGDLCNACVLCVKRWLGRGKQEGYFSQCATVDSSTSQSRVPSNSQSVLDAKLHPLPSLFSSKGAFHPVAKSCRPLATNRTLFSVDKTGRALHYFPKHRELHHPLILLRCLIVCDEAHTRHCHRRRRRWGHTALPLALVSAHVMVWVENAQICLLMTDTMQRLLSANQLGQTRPRKHTITAPLISATLDAEVALQSVEFMSSHSSREKPAFTSISKAAVCCYTCSRRFPDAAELTPFLRNGLTQSRQDRHISTHQAALVLFMSLRNYNFTFSHIEVTGWTACLSSCSITTTTTSSSKFSNRRLTRGILSLSPSLGELCDTHSTPGKTATNGISRWLVLSTSTSWRCGALFLFGWVAFEIAGISRLSRGLLFTSLAGPDIEASDTKIHALQMSCVVLVLDSKQGPGPKHMKEITKRARRREARQQQAAKASTTNRPSTSASSTLTNNGAAGASRGVHAGHHNHHPVHHSATCVACWADQNNSNSTPVAGASVARTRSAVARKLDTTGSVGDPVKGHFAICHRQMTIRIGLGVDRPRARLEMWQPRPVHRYPDQSRLASFRAGPVVWGGGGRDSIGPRAPAVNQLIARAKKGWYSTYRGRSGLWTPTESSGQVSLWEGYSPHNQEFRPPRPPSVLPGNGSILSSGGGSQGVVTRAAASASVYSSLAASGVAFFDGASSTASSTTSTPSTPTRRQNRRTRLPPVKISSDCVEVHDILQKIQKANQAMNLDNRQINMAMQREIRLRNRTVNPPVVAAAAASSSASSGVGVDRLLSGGGSGGGGGSADTSLVTGSSAAANAADLRI
ncbi:unnamed protein product [Mesocestoides corti]|uniref:Protein FAM60A n=1 Tax=Mesocestoides corti TaxID=53468 RepID=A0A0R3UJP2_MESCO|nr:unnamed protein product [Mesocestoides corti]